MDTINLILSQLPVWGAALSTGLGYLITALLAAQVFLVAIGAASRGIAGQLPPQVGVYLVTAGGYLDAAANWCGDASPHLLKFVAWLRSIRGPNLPPPPAVVAAVAMVAIVAMPSCAVVKPIARTALDIASDVCADFYATHKGVSWEEAVTTFCRTEEQLHPFLDELLAAQRRAGARAVTP